MKVELESERPIISQSHAARLRGVSRQRINELVAQGRFSTPVNYKGELVQGALYLDEVFNLEEGKRGRPRKSQSDWFAVGDVVLWNLKLRNGYGYTLPIVGKVVKSSAKKIQLQFIGGDGAEYFAWASRGDCVQLEESDEKANHEPLPPSVPTTQLEELQAEAEKEVRRLKSAGWQKKDFAKALGDLI